ncbi:hypothetical protein AB1Y20_020323 [Prymnesium parvum]|uniref:DNA/RNA-binding protein Alba-like domain-containing protein n=1 Tax=Prymnesium parvum TaxID=97485 RepID=A0AB34JXN9_PRYPA
MAVEATAALLLPGHQAAEAAVGTVRITSGGKIRAFVDTALNALPSGQLVLQAEGDAVSKAVTVAEITRRKLRGVHQNTQIGLVHPDPSREVGKKPARPKISITLSLCQLDATQPGYQRPLTEAEFLRLSEQHADEYSEPALDPGVSREGHETPMQIN